MTAYIVQRLLAVPVVLLILSLGVFFMVRAIPGDIVAQKLERTYTVERAEALRAHLGLDRPFYVQYPEWLGEVFRGDFGISLDTGRSVNDEIVRRLPITVELGVLTLMMSVVVGIPAGIITAVRQNGVTDQLLRLVSIIGLAVPTFWAATLVIVIAAIYLNWAPRFGYIEFVDDPIANLKQFSVPAAVGALGFSAILLRLTRVQMLEVLRQDYVRTARAKGLKNAPVVLRHALKNAMIPVVTVVGLSLAAVVSGSVFLERIFSLPGLGNYAVTSVTKSDYPVIQAFVLLTGLVFVLVNLVIDLLYAVLDPRIRYS